MLEVKKLTKLFKDNAAVNSIDVHLIENEILGFLGPNGAGKSTAISMISTLIKPTSGEILLDGDSVLKDPQKLRRILGVVPQDIALYPDLTGKENLEFFGKIYGLKKEQLKNRVEEVLAIVGLNDRANERVETYSGGMKRRINIAAALLHRPKILIMDEPTVGIDPQSRNHILTTVKKLNEEGMTILYTSHYMEEVEFLCDRIYIMDHGSIIAQGTKNELKELVADKNTVTIEVNIVKKELTNAIEGLSVVKRVLCEDKTYTVILERYDSTVMKELITTAENHGAIIEKFQLKTPSLEDVFLQLTGRVLRN